MLIQAEEIHTVEKRDLGKKIGQISDKQLAEIIFLRKIVLDSPDRYEIEKIGEKIEAFERLLNEHEDDNESVFHEFLYKNSFLLDLYGEPVSKPRFKYPTIIESPLRKAYVEPDFIIKYPNQHYKLVELEKPSKKVTTKRGHSSSELLNLLFKLQNGMFLLLNIMNKLKRIFLDKC